MNHTTYRDDLLAVSAVILGDGTTDRDLNHAIDLADRLIRQVDKFAASKQQTPPAQQSEDPASDPPPFNLPAWCKFKQHKDGGSLIRQLGHGVELRIGYTGGEPSQQWWEDTIAYLADIPPKQATDGVVLDGQDDAE